MRPTPRDSWPWKPHNGALPRCQTQASIPNSRPIALGMSRAGLSTSSDRRTEAGPSSGYASENGRGTLLALLSCKPCGPSGRQASNTETSSRKPAEVAARQALQRSALLGVACGPPTRCAAVWTTTARTAHAVQMGAKVSRPCEPNLAPWFACLAPCFAAPAPSRNLGASLT
jgi:hypothetical protein